MNNFLREADFEIHRASGKLHKRNNVEIKTFLVGFSIKVKYNIALYQMHMSNSQYFQNYYYVNNYFASCSHNYFEIKQTFLHKVLNHRFCMHASIYRS